jgi:hypothetical protein
VPSPTKAKIYGLYGLSQLGNGQANPLGLDFKPKSEAWLSSHFPFGYPACWMLPHHTRMLRGHYDGSSYCESLYAVTQPSVPYDNQSTCVSCLSETSFKSICGALTEGRYLTFEKQRLCPHQFRTKFSVLHCHTTQV